MTRTGLHDGLRRRLSKKRRFLQVLPGPRQAGKTTLARRAGEMAPLDALGRRLMPPPPLFDPRPV